MAKYIYKDADGKKRVLNQKPEGIITPIFKWSEDGFRGDDNEIINSKWSIKRTGYCEFSLVDPFGEERKAGLLMGDWGECSGSGHGLYFSIVQDFASWSAWDEYKKIRALEKEIASLKKEAEELKAENNSLKQQKKALMDSLRKVISGVKIIFPINNIRQLKAVFGKAGLDMCWR